VTVYCARKLLYPKQLDSALDADVPPPTGGLDPADVSAAGAVDSITAVCEGSP
jgi:hypothetical protein